MLGYAPLNVCFNIVLFNAKTLRRKLFFKSFPCLHSNDPLSLSGNTQSLVLRV